MSVRNPEADPAFRAPNDAPVPVSVGPYTVLVAPEGASEASAPRAPVVTLHPHPAPPGGHAEIRRVPSGLLVPEGRPTADDLLMRALAVLHGDVSMYAHVEAGPRAPCRLTLAPHTPDCGQRLILLRGTLVFADSRWHSLAEVLCDGTPLAQLPPADRISRLSAAADPASACADSHAVGTARLDPRLAAAAADVTRRALPAVAASAPYAAAHGDELDIGGALDSVRDLQHRAHRLYGRLEPERALSWFLEELGELAQAMRRREPSVRIEEELGQVAAWCLCIANITRVDLGGALSRALHQEHDRQLRKYGSLHPYVSQEEAC